MLAAAFILCYLLLLFYVCSSDVTKLISFFASKLILLQKTEEKLKKLRNLKKLRENIDVAYNFVSSVFQKILNVCVCLCVRCKGSSTSKSFKWPKKNNNKKDSKVTRSSRLVRNFRFVLFAIFRVL